MAKKIRLIILSVVITAATFLSLNFLFDRLLFSQPPQQPRLPIVFDTGWFQTSTCNAAVNCVNAGSWCSRTFQVVVPDPERAEIHIPATKFPIRWKLMWAYSFKDGDRTVKADTAKITAEPDIVDEYKCQSLNGARAYFTSADTVVVEWLMGRRLIPFLTWANVGGQPAAFCNANGDNWDECSNRGITPTGPANTDPNSEIFGRKTFLDRNFAADFNISSGRNNWLRLIIFAD